MVNDVYSGQIGPPYVRAVTRDLKNYIAKNAKRAIPVGYSAADVREILIDSWEYLQCAVDDKADDPSRIDFFGLNSYSWCGSADFHSAGYDTLTSDFASTTVPVFFSEYGCNKVPPGSARPFSEVAALYGPQMRAVLSGGLVYQWTQETNDFGLVQLNTNASISLLNDYDALQSQLNKIDLKGVTSLNSTAAALKPPKCSPSLIKNASFNHSFNIPPSPSGAQSLIANGVRGYATGTGASQPKSTDMPVPVYASNGREIKGLKLNVLANSAANGPNGGNANGDAGGAPRTSGASSSSSSGMSAPTDPPKHGAELALAALIGVALFG